MSIWQKIQLYPKALQELGLERAIWYMRYQIGLRSGYYQKKLQIIRDQSQYSGEFADFFHPHASDQLKRSSRDLDLSVADKIVQGLFRPFGGEFTTLDFNVLRNDLDWSRWRPEEIIPGVDIKDIWEPARFGWAIHLAKAYFATGNEVYVRCFWENFEAFSTANPAFNGPNWISAQEVGLRLIHLCATASLIWQATESTAQRKAKFVRSIALHAERIPVTLSYARAQNNNHLLSEAAGLFSAGRFLPDHPHAKRWQEHGWREFEQGILAQIEQDGNYMQHSVCYHRLMLMLALWMNTIGAEYTFSAPVIHRLQAATHWLDKISHGLGGKAPNLGSNDGSQILPFTSASVSDYKEIVETSKVVFLSDPSVPWNELRAWLGGPLHKTCEKIDFKPVEGVQRLDGETSTGFLRTADFKSRPAHADQFHFDLWWKGQNILRDAGTFRYNAPAPWDNRLSSADVHNVVTVDNMDQMTRAGKFLWLDWAQVSELSQDANHIYAQLTCPNQPGLRSTRRVEVQSMDTWLITDEIHPVPNSRPHQYRIHWLLPDAVIHPPNAPTNRYAGFDTWQMDKSNLILSLEMGKLNLETHCIGEKLEPLVNLYRAGELLEGSGPSRPTWGWYSPTYGVKLPALAWTLTCTSPEPVTIHTLIHLQPWQTESPVES